MDPQLYNELNKAWKSTCRILLGDEIGELQEYATDLRKHFSLIKSRKSHISEKEVTISSSLYCEDAKFISMEENKTPSVDALTINEIKDIDSIMRAVSEKWEYTGNKVLGNSSFIEKSDGIKDSQYIYDCVEIFKSSHLFSSFACDLVKYGFGCGRNAKSEFEIGVVAANMIKRGFYCNQIINSGDVYYSHHLEGCQEMMFCYHQLGKRNMIGNLQLSKDKYIELKKKLLEELREKIKSTKKIPSLFTMVPNEAPKVDINIEQSSQPEMDITPIEKSFRTVFRLIFKKEPGSIEEYEKWLTNRIPPLKDITTAFGNKTQHTKHPVYRFGDLLPDKRLVNDEEAKELSKIHIDESKLSRLDDVTQWMADTCCFDVEFLGGENRNYGGSQVVIDSVNVYKTYMAIKSQNVGFDYRIQQSDNSFGCVTVFDTKFSLKCYSSSNLMRCLELDSSLNCTDSMFSFNCEGLRDAMFCFNVRGKRSAIGNTELPPDQYKKIKEKLVEQMADELIKNKDLKFDIYNIGCYKQ